MHLVNTLGYLCQRESVCEFSGQTSEKANHFYIYESLPKQFRLPLVLEWEDGLRQLLQQKMYNLKWDELVRTKMDCPRHQWEIQIKDIPGVPLFVVLPVHKAYTPCSHSTPHFLHLMDGKKLYFERDGQLTHLTDEAWHEEQAAGGNAFCDVAGTAKVVPRPFHQKLVHAFKPDVDRNSELESENAELVSKNAELVSENTQLKSENAQLKEALKETRDVIRRYEATERDLLKKINELNDKIHRLNEGEITRLRKENEELKRENEKLKWELAGRQQWNEIK